MLPFLQKTAQYLVSEFPDDIANICIVLPNRRGGLFLRKYLAAEVEKITWAPAIYSIEDFIAEISGLQEIENIHLLFELFSVHVEIEGTKAQTFEEFIRWAPQLLSDFNEIDRYLADPEALFSHLTEARAIALWNLDGSPLTDFEKRYLQFYQSLYGYYAKLRDRLLGKKQAWQGLTFRYAAGNIETVSGSLPWKHIIFAGFNALTAAEEKVIATLRNAGKATMLYDADHYYLGNPLQEAGDFLRQRMKRWPEKEPRWISDDYKTSRKQIEIIGSPDPLGQVKYCGQVLQELALEGCANEKTAVVLLEEGLLIPVLNSMPGEVGSLNITAGLPLKQTPLADLYETILHLHFNAQRFTRIVSTGSRKYYYRDVLKLLQHPFIRRMAHTRNADRELGEIVEGIRHGSQVFIGPDDVFPRKADLFAADFTFLDPILVPWNKPSDVLDCFKKVTETLSSASLQTVELEYLFAFSGIFHQLGTLSAQFPTHLTLQSLQEIYHQIVASTSLPFYGEPLHGVQLMGMLETRTLDFENLVILSCNEDLLPSAKVNTSFIPYDIKMDFGLPTYRHKDSVYAYHFYRLLQRASRVWILYSTEADQLGGGDRSRFLRQITGELPAYHDGIVIRELIITSPPVKSEFFPPVSIPKTSEISALLVEKAKKGFSASSLNAYRNCTLKFYYAEIAGLKEPEALEDTIDPATLGSAVHDAMHRLYKPYLDRPLEKNALAEMHQRVDKEVDHAFEMKYKGSGITFGRNLLLVNVAKLMIRKFLRYEADQLEELHGSGKSCTVSMLEKYLETYLSIPFEGKPLEIRLKGLIDRADRMDGWWRVIDYKTGSAAAKNVRVEDWEDLIGNPGIDMGFQLLMYGYLLEKQLKSHINFRAGIISLRKVKEGFLAVSVPGDAPESEVGPPGAETTKKFEEALRLILTEIYDLMIPFAQTDDPEICRKCPYINLCGR